MIDSELHFIASLSTAKQFVCVYHFHLLHCIRIIYMYVYVDLTTTRVYPLKFAQRSLVYST